MMKGKVMMTDKVPMIGKVTMKGRWILLAALLATSVQLSGQRRQAPVDEVDPFIGSGGHGHVFVGAGVPFGGVQVGPNNDSKGWDWCSGYHYSDSVIIGFSQTHLSGTGIGDLGDVLIMPYTSHPRAKYTHADETVRPGYYAVRLKDQDVHVELTATERVAFHKYRFLGKQSKQSDHSNREAHVLIDLKEGVADKAVETFITQKDEFTLIGYRYSKGWAADHRVWFAIKSHVSLHHFELLDSAKGLISFDKTPDIVLLKVGISSVSSENALDNINAEIPGWDFAAVAKAARGKWNEELSRIQITTTNDTARKIFYTALYHTMIAPSLYNDHNGDYRGMDKKVYHHPGYDQYSVFSMWDAYRSNMPLHTIIHPDRVNGFINSMLAIYQQQGKLPIWELKGNETNTMPGYGAVPVVADACLKGFTGFDIQLAYAAMKASAMRDEYGLKAIKEQGYISAEHEHESVSKALEYALADWGIAAVAKKLGYMEDVAYFSKRAKYYQHYFDTATKFVRARMDDGSFKEPLDPFNSIHMFGDFAEGNAWQYTWLVPQDVEGLIALMGGENGFIQKLDSLFVVEGPMGHESSNDITGLIGMYAHGNEPSQHIPYLYAYIGQPWKTAEKVRQIFKAFYTTRPDGLVGNEDCGAMSSWYIMSAMGLYPVNPAKGVYVMGSPLFDKVDVKLAGGKHFVIEAVNNSKDNIYIQSVMLNGKAYHQSYIRYGDIMKGGVLQFVMGAKPDPEFGKAKEDRPNSAY